MTRRAYLYFALIFVLGVVVGAAGTYYYVWHAGLLHRTFNRERAVAHLKSDLHLTDAQISQLRQILGDYDRKSSDLQKQVEPQFNTLHEQTRDRIRQILSPEQLRKFNEIARRNDEARKRRGS
ncbi:MAG TPA: hypothetical protein VKM93_19425 [Terriglobia bacterium]|nr:hypothetical protein [Terriglobia bacterium]